MRFGKTAPHRTRTARKSPGNSDVYVRFGRAIRALRVLLDNVRNLVDVIEPRLIGGYLINLATYHYSTRWLRLTAVYDSNITNPSPEPINHCTAV